MESRNKRIQRLYRAIRKSYDFLTLDSARVDFYRWLSRKTYGQEARVINTMTGDRHVVNCWTCPFGRFEENTNMAIMAISDEPTQMLIRSTEVPYFVCLDRNHKYPPNAKIKKSKSIHPACQLHFRTPVIFQILPVIALAIAVMVIIAVAILLWTYK